MGLQKREVIFAKRSQKKIRGSVQARHCQKGRSLPDYHCQFGIVQPVPFQPLRPVKIQS